MAERGEIAYPSRIKQILRFSGFRYGSKTPTDIDFVIEYDNRAWVFGEIKLVGVELSLGQRLVLERLVKDACPKRSIAFLATHDVVDASEDVEIKACLIREYFQSKQQGWIHPNYPVTVKDFVDSFIAYIDRGRNGT